MVVVMVRGVRTDKEREEEQEMVDVGRGGCEGEVFAIEDGKDKEEG